MRIDGLKSGVYDSNRDLFIYCLDNYFVRISNSHISIKNGRIDGAKRYRETKYWLFNLYDLLGITSCSVVDTTRPPDLDFNSSISFDKQYMDYLIHQVEYLRDNSSEPELEISRFLIKEMEKLIYYKENVHDIPVRRHFYTDKPVPGHWPNNVSTKSANDLANDLTNDLAKSTR